MDCSDKSFSIGKVALLLALSENIEEEESLKNFYNEKGYICAVTGTGGGLSDLTKKINMAIIGACLNNNIIGKTPQEIHAVNHAALEAKEGMLMAAPSGASFAGKIAIVRYKGWIAVAIYGHSAMHVMTNHERAGLGIMHI